MPKQLSKEERLDRLIEKCRRDVAKRGDAGSLSQTPDRLLGTLAREAGYQRVGRNFRQILDERLRAEGLATWPKLDDPTITRATRIYLFGAGHQIPGLQEQRVLFDSEAPLSHFLQKNFMVLPYFKKSGLRYLDAEVLIAPGCKIDLLAEDKKSKGLVGIELKPGEPDKGLVSQAGRYMTALKQKAAKDGRPGARLLIVSGQPDREFQSQIQALAEKRGVPTNWLTYTVKMTLQEAP
ncbi:MAG: hypothetical protein R2763_01330 [Mycobacterium sp.]